MKDERKATRRIEKPFEKVKDVYCNGALYLLQGKFRSIMIGPTADLVVVETGLPRLLDAGWWVGQTFHLCRAPGFNPPTLRCLRISHDPD